MSEAKRQIEAERYTKRGVFFLDHDDGGYTNSYEIWDRGSNTGIMITATGHSRLGGHKQRVAWRDREYTTLREAIYAYEDAAETVTP